ncbi:MAG: type I restriction endonuclease subunit R, partial [Thermomicrobiales bacterium]|nr:type I restriction endonuclease subunit R [Thermomicrobiales bacterium]
AQTSGPTLLHANAAVSRLIVDGVPVEVLHDGEPRGHLVQVIDFDHPANNDLLAVNQVTVVEGGHERRPDVVLFVNGLPLVVIEFKNPVDPQADEDTAWGQFQTYQAEIPVLFRTNALLVGSDGLTARMGALGGPKERFVAWKTIDGDEVAPPGMGELEVMLKGVFAPARLLDLVRSFVLFEQDSDDSAVIVKKVAAYHQFHAVRKAVASTVQAAAADGDRRGGVVWHTQGSGKSLTMVLFAGKLIQQPALANPTIVALTDRIDLDDQLFGQFARGDHLLRQEPVQAKTREHLRELLRVASGGVVFATVQKFTPDERGEDHPLLTDRRNVVVLADEAHRSQYDLLDGYARHIRDALPNATFVGFTGTPLELDDKDTRLVFGDYIDVYDIARAVADGATVPISYESRLVSLELPGGQTAGLDAAFDEITETEEAQRGRLAAKWTQLEEVVGTPKRLDALAADLVAHFERREDALHGKAMVVGMSRRICVALYDAIAQLRPAWVSDDDATGKLKVVMTGSASDPPEWQRHIRSKRGRRAIEARFKNPDDALQIVIVRDMWLTGFDVPPLHTMYLDKPMRGHALMQAIARVNRVFRDKPGGLVVDYLGLANNLREALRVYSESGGRGRGVAGVDDATPEEGELVAVLREKLEVCRALMHGFDYQAFLTGSASERLGVLTQAQEFVLLNELRQPGFQKRYADQTAALLKAFALAAATEAAVRVKTEVAFFQNVQAALDKLSRRAPIGSAPDAMGRAVRQLIDGAIAPGGVVDIFTVAGLEKPDISILSEGFLDDVRHLEHKNLAVELLRKLLDDEIATRGRANVVQSRLFSERLQEALARYRNRSVETAQVIEELIALANELQAAQGRGEKLGLSEAEVAFYDALGGADMAAVMGDAALLTIAREVAATVRDNATIDWTVRDNVRARMRVAVKRVLRKHGYPPEKTEGATETVVRQAELIVYEQFRLPI